MKKLLTKALAVLLVCLFALSAVNFSISADDSNPLGEKLAAMNVKIRGSNRLMFYFTNIDNVEFFEVKIPQANGSVEAFKIYKNGLKYEKEKNRYLLEVPLAAAQLSEQVTIQAFDAAGNAGKLRSYSIKDYANQLFELAGANPDNANYANAAKALESMLNYGAMAQTFFGYKTENLANNGFYFRDTNPVNDMTEGDLYGITAAPAPIYAGNNIRFTSVSAYLDDAVSLRFYFEYTGTKLDSPKNLTVQIEGETYANEVVRDSNGNYYILINNIPASLYNKQYEVRLSEDESNYAVLNYSVFNYIQAKLEVVNDEKFSNVAYSMFQFYAWTNNYLGVNTLPASCSHERTHVVTSNMTTVCSDCGAVVSSATVPTFTHDGNGNVTTSEGLSYKVSGGTFEVNDATGFTVSKGETMTLTGTKITSTAQNNRFSMHYYASAPAKITVNYVDGHGETFYIEKGENNFSAVEWGFPNSSSTSKIKSISVEPLTSSVDFVLFSFSAETVSTSALEQATYNGVACQLQYIENSRYKLGINLTWGGAISELYDKTASDSNVKNKNLVNNFDAGRLIQQSYYGTDGSNDDYLPRYWRSDANLAYAKWRYNPVQGGDANNNSSRIIDFEVGSDYVYIKAQPLDWANHELEENGTYTQVESRYTECYIENTYTLSTDYIAVDNRMVDFSGYTHPCATQELPAFYTLAYFDDYYWYSGTNAWSGALTKEDNLPFWGAPANIPNTTFRYQTSNTETWAAFVNETSGYGIGLYVPNTDIFKAGRTDGSESNKSTDGASGYTSYIAPLKDIQIVCYEPIEYSYLICTGTVNDIRATFKANKDFADNATLDNNDINRKLPDNPDMSTIDFSIKDNLGFIQSTNDTIVSFDRTVGAAKLEVTGGDSFFYIDYTTYKDSSSKTYPTSDYACIQFTYMIPADPAKYPNKLAQGQVLYYQTGSALEASGDRLVVEFVTLVADGEWHTASFFTSNIQNGWEGNINSLRVDFLNNAIGSGQVMYLKSFSLTDGEQSGTGEAGKLNHAFTGNELKTQLTDGQWENLGPDKSSPDDDSVPHSSVIVCDGDFVRTTTGYIEDRHVGFIVGGTKVTGKYMVIKYRTDAAPISTSCDIFVSAGTDTLASLLEQGKDCYGNAYGWVGDGQWHTLVIDLAEISDSVRDAGENAMINEVRIDLYDCFAPGAIIDIAYVGFCKDIDSFKDSLDDSNKHPELSDREWSLAVDSVKMDEIKVPAGGVDYVHGANSAISSVIEGSVWNFSVWFAINGVKASSLEYCITEENGIENHFDIHYSASGATRYFDAEKAVTDYVRDSLKYTNPNDAKRLNINADLLAYLGQTVTITIRAITEDGYAVVLYAVKVKVTAPKYNSLNYVLTGDELYREMFSGDHDAIRQINQAPHAVVKNEDGTVSVRVTTLRSGGTARKWLGIQPNASTPTGKYMVIKYRTNGLPTRGHFYIYAASVGKIKNEDNRLSSAGFVGDGNWHTLVIDLSSAPAAGVNTNFDYCITDVRLQMLDNLADGEVVDFEYIGFCDSINDIPLKDGEHLEYSWQEWSASVDTVTMDGQPALKNSTGDEAGASQHGLLSGGQWAWSGGWFAIDGQSAKEVSVCITEEDGTAHRTTVTKGATNTSAPNTWWEATDITNYVKTHNGYSESTVGYRVNLSANLLEFLGQTVTVSVRALTNDDRTVTVYSASVYVPMSATAQWITGIELQKYINNSFHSKTPNSDGSLTLSAQPGAGTDNYTNELQRELAGVKAPRYAIIRYKTTDKTTLGMYARTTSSTGYVKLHGSIINDGKWHTVVFDLTISGQYTLGEDITFLRVDPCLLQGESITIDYVYLCDTIGDSGLDYSVDLIEKNNSSLPTNWGTIDRTPEGIRVTSAGFTGDSTRMSINLNGAKTGKYLVMTYRYASTNQKNANLANINVWTSTTNGGATGGDNQQANVLADGNWHTLVVDISKNKTVTANADGTYSLKYLALDVFSPASACAGDYLDISYIGFSDDFNEIADEFGETKYSVAYQLNTNGTLGSGQVHSWMSSATTVTRSKTATSNITGFATVSGKITDVYYQIVAADGSTAGWTNATSGIFNPGDNGYETYNSQSGTAQTIWLGTGGNIENAATFEIPASALEGYSAGDVITVLVAVKTTDMVEGSFAVLVSCTMTFTE